MSPAKRKTASKKTTKRSTAAAKKTTASKKRSTAKGEIRTQQRPGRSVTPKKRYQMIEQSAYLKAEKDNFRGDPAQYWVAAEAEIGTMLTKKKK